jgi:putative alpha-1,2-mannosidase
MPFPGCPGDNTTNCKFNKLERSVPAVNDSTIARPGYFAIDLVSGIRAEMTVTSHTALYRFKFGKAVNPTYNVDTPGPVVLVALEDLHGSARRQLIEVDEKTGRIMGNATFAPSFGVGNYEAFFCIDFKGAKVRDIGYLAGIKQIYVPDNQQNGDFAAAWTRFAASKEILARVGLSFKNNAQACQNAETEIPDFHFEKTLSAAQSAWDEKLSVVQVDGTGVDPEMLTIFWTGIYRSFQSPQDYTGENPLWNSTEPYYDSWYCIWDTFRTTHPLLSIVDPEVSENV